MHYGFRGDIIKNKEKIRANFMRKITYIILFLLLICQRSTAGGDWNVLKGEHFIIFYKEKEEYTRDVLEKAEKYYYSIAEDLGYARYDKTWTWEKRAKIYIYPDRDSYLEAIGKREWSHGMAFYKQRKIVSYGDNPYFIDRILPHEITHLIFRDYIGFKGQAPLWLDEGVAQWQEDKYFYGLKGALKEMMDRWPAMSIRELTLFDLERLDREKNKYLIDRFYIYSGVLIDFLISRYGTDNFIVFCRQLRDGKSLNGALAFAYPTSIRNMELLESEWKSYLDAF